MTTVAERVASARLRAMTAISHFATSSGGGDVVCHRCCKPLNRWDEKCDYALTTETMLAEDILFLLGELDEAKTRHAETGGQ